MEALVRYLNILLIALMCLGATQVQAQNEKIQAHNLEKLMLNYEATKDETSLIDLLIYGSNSEAVLVWFEKNMDTDIEVLTYAGMIFDASSLPKWNAKAEKTLLRSLKINPMLGVATRLGDIYSNGKNTSKDTAKGCEMYERAYKINPNSMTNIQYGLCLLPDASDRIFRKSNSEACKVFKAVAEGYYKFTGTNKFWEAGLAYVFLGDCYAEGNLDQKSFKDAVEWYRRGMMAGNKFAAFKYAEQLESGVGTLRDTKGALDAYNVAATLGLSQAQNRLGIIFAEGQLTQKNLVEAYKWFLIATSNGYEPAKDNRNRAESRLSRAEVRSAEGSAKQWLKENQQ